MFFEILCNVSVCNHSAIAENNVFTPRHHVWCMCFNIRHATVRPLLLAVLAFPHQLSLYAHLRTDGPILQWLDVILHVVHTLWISHDKSPYSGNVFPTEEKTIPGTSIFEQISSWRTIFSRSTQQQLSLSKHNYYLLKLRTSIIVYTSLVS